MYQAHKRLSPLIFPGKTYIENSDAFELTLKIFDTFHENVMKQGALPIIVLFPNKDDLKRYRKTNTSVFAPLLRHFEESGYRHIDLLDAFDKYALDVPLNELFDGHYTPFGNKVVAKYIFDYFTSNRLARRDEE